MQTGDVRPKVGWIGRYLSRLDETYAKEDHFTGRKARLLALINSLLLLFAPFNLGKLLLLSDPPELALRIGVNLGIMLAAFLSLRWLARGRLELAGNVFSLGLVVPLHVFVVFGPRIVERFGFGPVQYSGSNSR